MTENARFDWCGNGMSIILLEHRLKDQQELAELLECFVDAVTKCSKNQECNLVKDESDYVQYLEIAWRLRPTAKAIGIPARPERQL